MCSVTSCCSFKSLVKGDDDSDDDDLLTERVKTKQERV